MELFDRMRFTVLSRTLPEKKIEPMDARVRKYIFHGYITDVPNVQPCRKDEDCIDGQECRMGVCTGVYMDHVLMKDNYEDWLKKRFVEHHPEIHWGHNVVKKDEEHNYDFT